MLILAMASTPTHAWLYPNDTEDKRFEMFGPRADILRIKLYYSKGIDMFTDFEMGEFDLLNSHPDHEWVLKWTESPYKEKIKVVPQGPTPLIFGITINTNNNRHLGEPPDPNYDNPVYPNPCSVPSFRHALAHLMDREFMISTIWRGHAGFAYTLVPPSMPDYIHPDIIPAGTLSDLCHLYNVTEANRILDTCDEAPTDGHPDFPINPGTGMRFWDRDGNGQEDKREKIELMFLVDTSDWRITAMGDNYGLELQNNAHIYVNFWHEGFLFGPITWVETPNPHEDCFPLMDVYFSKSANLALKNFSICTTCWNLGSILEHLAMFHSSNYWHPGECPNYGAFNCPQYDHWVEEFNVASTIANAQHAAYEAQRVFADPSLDGIGCIPAACYWGYKAVQRRYTGGNAGNPAENKYVGSNWRGIVNSPAQGTDNWWSFLNMYPENHLVGDGAMTIRWGYTDYCQRLNPLLPGTSLDCEVLNLVYDSLLKQNPYTGEWVPWLCESFEVGTWKDPNCGLYFSKVKFTLRNDVYWHDGTPFTTADVAYTLCEIYDDLPWLPCWSGNLANIRDYRIIDPLNIEILFDWHYIWAPYWIGSNIILPKHIWKPIVDSGDMQRLLSFSPDPKLIGTGPWRFSQYVTDTLVELIANKPGTVVNGITSPRYWQLHPVHISIEPQNSRFKFDPGYPNMTMQVGFSVKTHNLWLNQSSNSFLTASRYVYVDGTLIQEAHSLNLPSCTPLAESFTVSLAKCKHEIKVAVRIDGPAMLDASHANPWISTWINVTAPIWITVKQDVGGALYRNKVVAPDFTVNGKDVALASSAFNTVPGMEKWNSVTDVTGDYKVDGKDAANIAKYFGKW